ncbi:hydrogenase expression/formation protein HypE [Streptomyces sp. NPDC060275]|uniref:hydrogenase expression/formation protein HypE n=1 Tax=Streptomyces sp. NPDC060275 TaxID=3347090 RepID=UPI0036615B79
MKGPRADPYAGVGASGDGGLGLGPVGDAPGDGLGAMGELLREIVFPALRVTGEAEDAATVDVSGLKQALTTDVFSVDPLIFPGGDIGQLAVCGVINDLAASGARAEFLTVGLLMSASLDRGVLSRVLTSFGDQAADAGCRVVCGDTKVHQAPQPELIITVTALGTPFGSRSYPLTATRPGDLIGVTGPLGSHSIAVLSEREGLGFERITSSDVAPLIGPVEAVTKGVPIQSLRDLTRGGLIATLWDGARAAGGRWHIEEARVPVEQPVRAATELLGLDPLLLTNEGTLLFTVDPAHADEAVRILAGFPATAGTRIVGEVSAAQGGTPEPAVTMLTVAGQVKAVHYPHALGVPRLC